MMATALSSWDLVWASLLLLLDGALSVLLGLGLHRRLALAATRMVVQLLLVGVALRLVFAAASAWVTLGVMRLMAAATTREIATRPRGRLERAGNRTIAATTVGVSAGAAIVLSLCTAIRPVPVWDPRYAVPLAGIVLGSVLNAASLTLEGVLERAVRERPAIEAQLALGIPYRRAMRPVVRAACWTGLMPSINQMSAAGIITLPGIMTGQILAGMEPMGAVKYQILVLLLLAGSGGLAAVLTAELAARWLTDDRDRLRLDRLRHRPSS